MEKLKVYVDRGRIIVEDPDPEPGLNPFWVGLSFGESAELTNRLLGAQRKLLEDAQRQLSEVGARN
jgi:hypothetical protein